MRWRWRKGSQRLSHMRCGRNEAGDVRLSELIITSEEFKNSGYFLTVYVKLTLPASNHSMLQPKPL